MAVAARELKPAHSNMAAGVRDHKRSAGKQERRRKRKGKLCCTAVEIASLNAAVREIASPDQTQTAITLPLVERHEAPATDLDKIKNDANLAYQRKQAESESAQEPKHILQIIKEQVEANNRKGYLPYISLEDAYAGCMMWLKQEEEEELEEWRERREHEAEMRLRQDEARRAAIRQAEIEAEQQKISYPSFPMGRWHEREDDLDDGWW